MTVPTGPWVGENDVSVLVTLTMVTVAVDGAATARPDCGLLSVTMKVLLGPPAVKWTGTTIGLLVSRVANVSVPAVVL
jgi:hypothetical protein